VAAIGGEMVGDNRDPFGITGQYMRERSTLAVAIPDS
jgi:hypothetical protein